MRFQQMKPKEFQTLMLIYFLSISTQMFLSKSILTGISLLLPAIWNSRENSQKKSISNSPPFISCSKKKKKISFPWGNCCAKLLYIKFTQLGLHGKRSLYLTFLLDRMTPKHPLNGWMSNLLRGNL